VADYRRFNRSANLSRSEGRQRVIEPEMDMKRSGPGESSSPVTSRIVDLVRRLAPNVKLTGSPMRSVAREIEELWPSRER
jgi:hypothetical protein